MLRVLAGDSYPLYHQGSPLPNFLLAYLSYLWLSCESFFCFFFFLIFWIVDLYQMYDLQFFFPSLWDVFPLS